MRESGPDSGVPRGGGRGDGDREPPPTDYYPDQYGSASRRPMHSRRPAQDRDQVYDQSAAHDSGGSGDIASQPTTFLPRPAVRGPGPGADRAGPNSVPQDPYRRSDQTYLRPDQRGSSSLRPDQRDPAYQPSDGDRGHPGHTPDVGYPRHDERPGQQWQPDERADEQGDEQADEQGDEQADEQPESQWRPDEHAGPQPATRRQPPARGSHLPPYSSPPLPPTAGSRTRPGIRSPRKLTVTRVAALRSRELTQRGVEMFHKATTADGADKSGLTALTYSVMANYAVDAALAVALAGTLFFAAATAESTGRVLLYLVITVAPFAVITPFIGPMLDRLQSGRRLALALSSFGRALLAIVMAFNFSHFNPWVIYPCALGNLVLSRAFGVLKAALTPRVLPTQITLVKTNSRLTTFGMIAGGAAGVLAAGLSKVVGSPGALFLTAACAVTGGVLCLRIPGWVESTEGEVPIARAAAGARRGFPRVVLATLWANSVIRVETGFLALFIAFVVKSQFAQHNAFSQLLLLGVVGAAAGVGGFVGNTMGAALHLSVPEKISLFALIGVLGSTVIALILPGLATAALVGFVGSAASSLAKVSLDSVIQDHLPEESRASGFGVSESVLQLGWVFGGVIGLLLGGVWTFGSTNVYAIGFATITVLLLVGLIQSWLVGTGRTMFGKFGAGSRAGSRSAAADGRREPALPAQRRRKAGRNR